MHSLAAVLQEGDDAAPVAFDGERQWRRGDWLRDVARLASRLRARAEPRWLLLHEDSYRFSIGLFALLAAGKHVVLPPNAQPGTLVALQELPLLQLDDELAVASGEQCEPLPRLDGDALAITVLTSGSTGAAKSICKPLRCYADEVAMLEQLWGEQLGSAAVLSSVSHQHVYGLLFRLLWPLVSGRPFASQTLAYPEMLLAACAPWPRAVLVSSPALLSRFPPAIDLAQQRQRLVAVFSSGGLLPFATAQQWQQRLGRLPLEILGSSETGGVAWRQQHGDDEPWQALPGVAVCLQGEQDLLAVQSPFTGEAGWLAMGDRARLLGDGRFRLCGRADTIVKVGEKRLSLTAMERVLCEGALVAAARVVPLPDHADRLGAVLVLSPAGHALLQQQGRRVLIERLRDGLLQQFERVLLPRKWRLVAQLPHDSQGKTAMAGLQQLFRDNAPAAAEVLEHNAVRRIVRWHFSEDSGLFDGHFPGLPILPGVVQFDLAVRQCAAWYPLQQFRRIERLKFQEPVVPGDTVTLQLDNLGNGQVAFSYMLAAQPLSSGRMVFAGGDADA